MLQGAASLDYVPGRFQSVDCGQNFAVVVDYAHTDDALRNIIAVAREFVSQRGGRVITMFGCGGDRDRSKRPLMGRAAGAGSDVVVLTSDNPRGEDPLAIIEQVLPGPQAALRPGSSSSQIASARSNWPSPRRGRATWCFWPAKDTKKLRPSASG